MLRQQRERLLPVGRRPRWEASGAAGLRDPRDRPELSGEELPLILRMFPRDRKAKQTQRMNTMVGGEAENSTYLFPCEVRSLLRGKKVAVGEE